MNRRGWMDHESTRSLALLTLVTVLTALGAGPGCKGQFPDADADASSDGDADADADGDADGESDGDADADGESDGGGDVEVDGDEASPDDPLGVTGLILVNAVTDLDIGPLREGDALDLEALGEREIAVRAEVGSAVRSVVFDLDGEARFRVESEAPYALHGDESGDYAGWSPATGEHTVTATGYERADGAGASGPPLTVRFSVVSGTVPENVFEEVGGLVAVEAEHYASTDANGTPRAWYLTSTTHTPGITPDPDPSHAATAAGGAYVEGLPDTRVTHDDPLVHGENFFQNGGQGPLLHYRIHFSTPGRYYVRVRAYSTGTEDNGLHAGINGTWPASGERIQWCEGKNRWTWSGAQRTETEHCGVENGIYLDVPGVGEHTISFSMREDGFEFDRFVLTTDSSFFPIGEGPAERRRE